MRIHLRQKQTGLYLSPCLDWEEYETSLKFPSGTIAMDVARKRGFHNVEVVYKFDEERFDFTLDVC
jgi:hypothetical protein